MSNAILQCSDQKASIRYCFQQCCDWTWASDHLLSKEQDINELVWMSSPSNNIAVLPSRQVSAATSPDAHWIDALCIRHHNTEAWTSAFFRQLSFQNVSWPRNKTLLGTGTKNQQKHSRGISIGHFETLWKRRGRANKAFSSFLAFLSKLQVRKVLRATQARVEWKIEPDCKSGTKTTTSNSTK